MGRGRCAALTCAAGAISCHQRPPVCAGGSGTVHRALTVRHARRQTSAYFRLRPESDPSAKLNELQFGR